MTATNQNFSMYQGETKNLVVTVTKDDSSALDMTGGTVKWGVGQDEYSTNDILKTTPEIIVSGDTITIQLKPPDTGTLLGGYYHECKLTDQFGNVSTLFTGTVTIEKSAVQ